MKKLKPNTKAEKEKEPEKEGRARVVFLYSKAMTGTRGRPVVSGPRNRMSPQPSNSDGVNGGSGFQGDDRTRHQGPEAHEKGNNGGDDGRREKSPTLGDNVDRLRPDACVVRDGEDNKVLVCQETPCPITVHHSCMSGLDELGNSCCPYKWLVEKVHEKFTAAEKRVIVRETASLSVDMAVMMGRDGGETMNVIGVNMCLNPCENRGGDVESSHECVESEKNQQCEEEGATECRAPIQRKDTVTRSGRKRKLLVWTPEEEEMLRIGVEKFSKTANRNMPWSHILKFGESVFHEERTQADLKAKWKKMTKTL
ncbi:PREDICTED: uncharacterized protein LOC104826636 [Tarenaya hassleriana]|uniref:uncharacterized protein LOC104826636 n=1 Tax=Tarenaya hassleriana TaxID=28532 RepID=UPI00053C8748|nr:PREDICTED: uncharacterized protein LOC104826636 [Tarenaya hassleriana]